MSLQRYVNCILAQPHIWCQPTCFVTIMQAEFAAEQEQMKLLSYLTPEEQNAYRARQSISFMYQRPAGYQVKVFFDIV